MSEAPKPNPQTGDHAVQEERRKAWRLSRVADVICLLLANPSVSLVQACRLVHLARRYAFELFPDKEAVFEMIYCRRFKRIIFERLSRSPEFLN
ncbi:MAG: hypothetical protein ONB48_01455 [candidate division KSB1 bacterium]|nr:hypothetical protein [candidate division KSB1 bacterium]MDZ7272657.1 hypothetical protein [candidate division KSB1 bacterium]MDZ7284321.1 hypothetical protein [candidate division KSB1 bacterium]MDZ7297283.1 hypothetical protein [candidate division KSB1 bacterium]MDZ7309506.1 hypothetical protein [candidate division KSB1 bacterium]